MAPNTCGSPAPLAWLVIVTFTAAWQKIFSPLPRVGFLAQVSVLQQGPLLPQVETLIFNNRLDAAVCGTLWYGILRGIENRRVIESPFVLSRLRMEEF